MSIMPIVFDKYVTNDVVEESEMDKTKNKTKTNKQPYGLPFQDRQKGKQPDLTQVWSRGMSLYGSCPGFVWSPLPV